MPEATFSYSWTAIEDFVVQYLSEFALSLGSEHVGLRHDAVTIQLQCHNCDRLQFKATAEMHTLTDTGYQITPGRAPFLTGYDAGTCHLQ